MTTIAYLYSDIVLDPPVDGSIWGLEVDRIYQDLSQNQQRPQLRQLLQDCAENPPNYILVRRLEEFGTSIEEICDHIATLETLGIQIIVTEQSYSTPQLQNLSPSALRDHLASLFSEVQTQQRHRQLRKGHAQNRLNLRPPPGKAPYGYRRGQDRYLIDRSTAPVVKDFFEQYLLFGSLRQAVRYLENRYGKKISVSTGKQWLTNPVYRGNLRYQNQEIIPNTHVPILSKDEAAQIDRLIRRNRRLPPRTASAKRSLAGLVYCQDCHCKLKVTRTTSRRHRKEYLYLSPVSCPRSPKCSSISYQEALEQTIERICQDLPSAVKGLNLPNPEGLKGLLLAEIEQKSQILEQLPELQATGILDEMTLKLRRYQLSTEIAQLQDQLAQLPPVNLNAIATTISLPQFWLDLSESERRFYFREFIRQIEWIPPFSQPWQLQLIFIF